MQQKALQRWFREITTNWHSLSAYERFEQLTALILSITIGAVVLVALFYLVLNVFELLVIQSLNPFDYRVFQAVFERIMTVLIATEFNHSIVRSIERRQSIIQIKTVILVAILAMVRKFIILDIEKLEALPIAALSLGLLVLGIVYWLMRERDDRIVEGGTSSRTTSQPVKQVKATPSNGEAQQQSRPRRRRRSSNRE